MRLLCRYVHSHFKLIFRLIFLLIYISDRRFTDLRQLVQPEAFCDALNALKSFSSGAPPRWGSLPRSPDPRSRMGRGYIIRSPFPTRRLRCLSLGASIEIPWPILFPSDLGVLAETLNTPKYTSVNHPRSLTLHWVTLLLPSAESSRVCQLVGLLINCFFVYPDGIAEYFV